MATMHGELQGLQLGWAKPCFNKYFLFQECALGRVGCCLMGKVLLTFMSEVIVEVWVGSSGKGFAKQATKVTKPVVAVPENAPDRRAGHIPSHHITYHPLSHQPHLLPSSAAVFKTQVRRHTLLPVVNCQFICMQDFPVVFFFPALVSLQH